MATILGNELLRGEQVYLNRITRDDLPRMAEMYSDLEFLRYLTLRQAYPPTVDDMETWYRHMGEEDAPPMFAVRLQSDDQFIGVCAFKEIRWQARHAKFWIGIGDPRLRGRGYGSDATRVLLRYGFMEMNLNCIALEVFSYNEAALATYRKLGFRQDGLLRAYQYRDGIYHDVYLMSMLHSEWKERYGG